VRHGETGWRIAPDDPRALAAALDVALGLSPEARAALGARARAAVQARFSTAAMQDATLAVYNELL
jgi:glycosyltransferase involved in cell wall biosynthesis